MSRRDVIPSNVTFHQAEESDFQGMVRLCENQGWDTEDHHRLASVLPSAVHVARCGTKIVGVCFGVPLNDEEAFIGSVAVDIDFRRQGIATRLVERTLAALGDRNVTMYASPFGLPLYQKFGFKSEEKPTYFYEVKFNLRKDGLSDLFKEKMDVTIVPLPQVDFKELIAYDTDIHRINREDWIKSIADQYPDSVAALNESNQIVGYAGVYHCAAKEYTELKPMLADSPNVAVTLLEHIMKVTPEGHDFKVKIISENIDAMSLMERIGFSTEMKSDTVMFNKQKFQVKTSCIYSLLNGNNQFA